jgi:hypothetical protein
MHCGCAITDSEEAGRSSEDQPARYDQLSEAVARRRTHRGMGSRSASRGNARARLGGIAGRHRCPGQSRPRSSMEHPVRPLPLKPSPGVVPFGVCHTEFAVFRRRKRQSRRVRLEKRGNWSRILGHGMCKNLSAEKVREAENAKVAVSALKSGGIGAEFWAMVCAKTSRRKR